MVPRSGNDFSIQMQINQDKDLAQILQNDVQELSTGSITLKPGPEYVIEVDAKGQTATKAFRDLSIEERKCKLEHEVDVDSIFRLYSLSNCKYECHVLKAYEICGCRPWDFMHMNNSAPECDSFGRTCFYRAMKTIKHNSTKSCPQCIDECDKFTFHSKVTESHLIQMSNVGNLMFCDQKRYLCAYEDIG